MQACVLTMGGRFFHLIPSASSQDRRARGGRKLKSNLQICEGMRVPAAWDVKIAA